MSAPLCSVGDGNSNQLGTNGFGAVDGRVTSRTKGNQIMGMVVRFVLVNMMHMQSVSPSFALFIAKLARPFIAVFDLLTKTLPVWRIGPFSNATLPGRIVGARDRAARDKSLRCVADFHSELLHYPTNRPWRDVELSGDLRLRSVLFVVFALQPFGIMVDTFRKLVSADVLALMTYVFRRWQQLTTSASTERRWASWFVDRSTWAALASFRIAPALVAMTLEQHRHLIAGATKSLSGFIVGWVVSCREPCPVVFADGKLCCFIKHARGLSALVVSHFNAIAPDNTSDYVVTTPVFSSKFDGSRQITIGLSRIVATAYFTFLFFGKCSLRGARGMIGVHQNPTFWCQSLGRFTVVARHFLLGCYRSNFSIFGLDMQRATSVGGAI